MKFGKIFFMTNIFLLTKNKDISNFLLENDFTCKIQENLYPSIYDDIEDFSADIIVVDGDVENALHFVKKMHTKNSQKTFSILYLTNDVLTDVPSGVKILPSKIDKELFLNEIQSSKYFLETIKTLHKENRELKKNLYQIDTFYNASSQFAGTLDKERLLEITFETFERILSYDLACALVKDDFEGDNLKFYLYSLKKISPDLASGLLKRLSLASLEENLSTMNLQRNRVETIQKIKPSYKNEFFDSSLISFDTLLAPIVIKGKFEGVVELFRKTPFTKEDVACFQSIVHQVLAPLRSAVLYEEIINANSKLKKLERMKSEFVSIVSHELRTPLTPINNALSIILSEQAGAIGEVNKNFVNIAKRNVSRLSGIIEDLLDLSRMQTGKFDFKFKKTSIIPSLELAYNTFKNQAQSKNLDFQYKNENNLKEVYIDPHRIDQIISNLITNAIKFTPEGGKILIDVSVQNGEEFNFEKFISPINEKFVGEYVKITVEDTGVGIEEENIPKIFDKFSQIESSLARTMGGIGLGLTITKHFIDAHLGAIWVESEKNTGSKFNVIIPVYSEKTEFEVELNNKIKGKSDVGYIKIIENKESGFFEYLKENNIIKPVKSAKEFMHFEEDKKITEIFIPEIERGAFEFMSSKIQDEINSKDEKCGIVLTKGFYKKDHC